MMTGIAFWILSSDRSSSATAAARSSPYLINEATDSLPINIRKMALGLWRLTSKHLVCIYKRISFGVAPNPYVPERRRKWDAETNKSICSLQLMNTTG